MWPLILFCVLAVSADEEDFRIIKLDSGLVRGNKYWNGDYYEFYGIPYATAPSGRDRFKAPLPVKPWDDLLSATDSNKRCRQCYYTPESDDDVILDGDDDCLVMNVLVPKVTDESKKAPVVVYIHSGAFSGGSGMMARYGYLARHDVVVVSFNYRIGALGFACLGNEEIPGNAGLKDQVEALRWIKRNIAAFGGDPDKITLAGFSVGAAMAELLSLSKATVGLFNQLILESGSALSPFTINRDPVSTAWNIAQAIGYNGTENIEDLTEFYLNAEIKDLSLKSINYFLPNSTFGFAPCIERPQQGHEVIVSESPLDTLKRGDYDKIPVMTGFSNMEGISRSIKFGPWREEMNDNFANFLPVDLRFKTEEEKNEVISKIKKRYFKDKIINHESLQHYIDYFSDIMFKYSIMKSAKLHSSSSDDPVYLYEFSYVGKLNIQHNYMDKIKGASHRDQTAYILDFLGFTNNYKDLTTRDRMTTMWSDFVQYGNPTEYESALLAVKWIPYSDKAKNYLEINKNLQMKQGIFDEEFNFWDEIYAKFYWSPTPVNPEITLPKSAPKKSDNLDKNQTPFKEGTENKNNFAKEPQEKFVKNDEKLNDNKEATNKPVGNKSSMVKTTTKTRIDQDGNLIKEVIKEHNPKAKANTNTPPTVKITTETKKRKDGKLVKEVRKEYIQNSDENNSEKKENKVSNGQTSESKSSSNVEPDMSKTVPTKKVEVKEARKKPAQNPKGKTDSKSNQEETQKKKERHLCQNPSL
ncbi:unnamed protein product [Leptosia nina]|uniref:Carboxylesterase type B domain-containing protein n=1 Tax=Leptosia nina TaxID=320188 RepID=A0AAV1JN65_9NEOP